MKLTYHFNLASLSKRQLNAHLRQLFNALSSADDVDGHRQVTVQITRVQREIINRMVDHRP